MDLSEKQEMLAVAPEGAPEEPLIEESVWGAVRALRERGLSKKEIGRQLDLDIKTVRKWLRQKWEPQRRPGRGRALDRWEGVLRERAPEVGFNAAVLYRELKAQGYAGSYPSLVRYLRPWREEHWSAETSTVRFETSPGEQAQVDWGSAWVWLGEERVRVHVFTMVLGYSRRIFARGYREEGLASLLDGHAQAFEHFGGRTETILYDNPRTIVLAKDESSGQVEWNAKFKDRMDFYGVTIRLCRYYRAQTKGKVESGVKYVKRNALAGRRFGGLEELNVGLLQWCLEVADQRVHGTTHELPAQRFARSEAAALNRVDARPPAPQECLESRIVPRDGLVAVEANRYPVPLSWAGHTVRVHLLAEEILLRRDGEETIRHGRLWGKHQVARWNGPPRSTPAARVAPAGPPRFDPIYQGGRGRGATAGLLRGGAMSGLAIEQVQEQMRQLKLVRTAEQLPLLLQDASKAEVSYSEFLAELLGRELAAKQERHTAMKTTMARFPFQKSLESFDFKFQPSIEPKVVRELATGRFRECRQRASARASRRGQDPLGGGARP